MALVIRHGGESHVMRPDAVHRSSILRPIVGYNPQADVQAVAQAFTQGPPSGTVLSGLGATMNIPSGIKLAWLRFKAAFASRGAGYAATDNQMSAGTPAPTSPVFTAQVVAPQAMQQMAMVARITNPQDAGQYGARIVAKRRYNSWYRAY